MPGLVQWFEDNKVGGASLSHEVARMLKPDVLLQPQAEELGITQWLGSAVACDVILPPCLACAAMVGGDSLLRLLESDDDGKRLLALSKFLSWKKSVGPSDETHRPHAMPDPKASVAEAAALPESEELLLPSPHSRNSVDFAALAAGDLKGVSETADLQATLDASITQALATVEQPTAEPTKGRRANAKTKEQEVRPLSESEVALSRMRNELLVKKAAASQDILSQCVCRRCS